MHVRQEATVRQASQARDPTQTWGSRTQGLAIPLRRATAYGLTVGNGQPDQPEADPALVSTCVFGVGEERERSCMGFVCMLSAELGQAFVNFAWAATRRNAGLRQRHQSTSGHLSMWKPLYMAFMHV